MGVRRRAPEGRETFKEFIEIGPLKLKHQTTLHKFDENYCADWEKHARRIEISTRSGLRAHASEFYWFFPHLIFPGNPRVDPKDKLIIHYLEQKWFKAWA